MSLFLMEDKSLNGELLNYFDYKKDTPTSSAFVQARAKIKPEAFKDFLMALFRQPPITEANICTRNGFPLQMLQCY